MSRGLGKVERELLAEIGEHGTYVPVTKPDWGASRNEARRRAARSLEAKGLVGVYMVKGNRRRHMVACAPEHIEDMRRNEARSQVNETMDAFEKAVERYRETKPDTRIPRIVFDDQPMTEDYPEQDLFDGEELDS